MNCEVISESIMEDISLKRGDYKGFHILYKILNLYKFSTVFIESMKETGVNVRTKKSQ